MDADALRDHLVAELGDAVEPEVAYGTLTVTVDPGDWRRVAELARRGPDLACNFFDFLCGVDEEADGIGVVLHVYSTSHRHHLQVRTVVPATAGTCRPSATCGPAPTGTSGRRPSCSGSASTATPTWPSCCCPRSSRATRCARSSPC